MKLGPDITRIAALLGEPARANMLTALMGGEALTAGELAREAGVTPQTASSHLAKLEADGLVSRRHQGRHSYFALAGQEIAELLEQLAVIAERSGHMRTRPGPRDPAMRRARVCYDHLAGEAAVRLLARLRESQLIVGDDDSLALSARGELWAAALGIDLEALHGRRRMLCRPCLDWSERRTHLAGALGAAILDRMVALRYVRRTAGRAVTLSEKGERLVEQPDSFVHDQLTRRAIATPP
jgi:DNA-binding transcriptional ArsR family regulator